MGQLPLRASMLPKRQPYPTRARLHRAARDYYSLKPSEGVTKKWNLFGSIFFCYSHSIVADGFGDMS